MTVVTIANTNANIRARLNFFISILHLPGGAAGAGRR